MVDSCSEFSKEGRSIAPTPPASPFSKDNGAFSIGSVSYSPYSLEGVVIPTAHEHILESEYFRRSLVNPFSERFLYTNSSPRGPTWSCLDDVVLKEKYYPSPSKKLFKSREGLKGLKLILMHN
ncbi:unnamed protein product [Fraxinus pennsylvanica]|uniref:Uncharacterized protein n=1 Tax=Fraxinus pennsylvanica TaxID=56036 RepID=A0AAD2AFB3_9LAMI|nr:unnamed protein product [Fraxinus pennsylvanica]